MKRKGVLPTLKSFFNTSARLHNLPGRLDESRKWRTLTDLLENPWFERLWVVQEVVMAPDEMSRTSCHEDPIIPSFESRTISFEMFATVIQRIWDDHLHVELAHDLKGKDATNQLAQYPPISSLIPIQTLSRGNESFDPGAKCNVDYTGASKLTIIQRIPEQQISTLCTPIFLQTCCRD